MKKRLFLGVLTAGILAPRKSDAQTVQVQVKPGDGIDVKNPSVDTQPTPDFQAAGVKSKSWKPRDWLEIEAEFEAKGVLPRNAVIPKLLFRYYAAIRGPKGPKVLKGETTHINVEDGEKYYTAAYVSPSNLGKITGDFRRFQTSAIEGVGIEVLYNGVLVGGVSTAGGKFWEQLPPEAGVVGKADSPFALLWIDRYADVEPKGN